MTNRLMFFVMFISILLTHNVFASSIVFYGNALSGNIDYDGDNVSDGTWSVSLRGYTGSLMHGFSTAGVGYMFTVDSNVSIEYDVRMNDAEFIPNLTFFGNDGFEGVFPYHAGFEVLNFTWDSTSTVQATVEDPSAQLESVVHGSQQTTIDVNNSSPTPIYNNDLNWNIELPPNGKPMSVRLTHGNDLEGFKLGIASYADIKVDKNVSITEVYERDSGYYIVNVENLCTNSASAAFDVKVPVALPSGVTYTSSSITSDGSNNATYASSTGLLTIPKLSCDEKMTLKVDFMVNVGTGNSTITSEIDEAHITMVQTDVRNNHGNLQTTFDVLLDTPPKASEAKLLSPTAACTTNKNITLSGTCGISAANGLVQLTTNPPNGFTTQYDANLSLDVNGSFSITSPQWEYGSYDIVFNCYNMRGTGPTRTTHGKVVINDNCKDTDGDNIRDSEDIDDDDDGILDIDEGDGRVDTDGDNTPDSLDTDSDNDTILDSIEGHDANSDGVPDTKPSGRDQDQDGLDDAYDPDHGGTAAAKQDTDDDGKPDWRDIDDDGDGILTKNEPTDADGSGIPDYLEVKKDPPSSEDDTLVAVDDNVSVMACSGIVSSTVAMNDSLPAGTTYEYEIESTPKYGSVVLETDGTFIYTAKEGFEGGDNFVYRVNSANSPTDNATVTLNIYSTSHSDEVNTLGLFWFSIFTLLTLGIMRLKYEKVL